MVVALLSVVDLRCVDQRVGENEVGPLEGGESGADSEQGEHHHIFVYPEPSPVVPAQGVQEDACGGQHDFLVVFGHVGDDPVVGLGVFEGVVAHFIIIIIITI